MISETLQFELTRTNVTTITHRKCVFVTDSPKLPSLKTRVSKCTPEVCNRVSVSFCRKQLKNVQLTLEPQFQFLFLPEIGLSRSRRLMRPLPGFSGVTPIMQLK